MKIQELDRRETDNKILLRGLNIGQSRTSLVSDYSMSYRNYFFRTLSLRLLLIVLLSQTSLFIFIGAQENHALNSLNEKFLSQIESVNNPLEIITFIQENKKEIPQLITHLSSILSEDDSLNFKLSNTANFIYLTSLSEGRYLAQQSYNMAIESNDTLNILYATSVLATIIGEVGEYQEALKYFFEILKISDPVNQYKDYSSALNEIGRLYLYLNDLENAKRYFEQEIAVATSHHDEFTVNIGYLNLGCVLMEQGDLDTGLEFMNKSYQFGIKEQDTSIQYNTLGNLAIMYFEKNKIRKAIDLQEKGLAFERIFNDKIAMIDSYANLALFNSQLNNRKKSLEYYEKSLNLAVRLNVVDKIISTYASGVEIYTGFGDYKKALEISKLQHNLYDSTLNLERNDQVAEMREKYETEKKESDILDLQKDKQLAALALSEEKNQNTILIVLSLLFLVIAVSAFIIFYYTRKRKREVEARNEMITGINKKLNQSQDALVASNKTRDKFFALIAHDLRGPITSFQGIGRVLEYTFKKGKPDSIDELIGSIDDSANKVNVLLDNLLKWALSQTGNLPFNPKPLNLKATLNDTVTIYEQSYQAKNIALHNEIKEDIWVLGDHNMISTIIRNLLGNALKFTAEGGVVTIDSMALNQAVEITVSDNGVGISTEKLATIFKVDDKKSTSGTKGEKGTGLGLMLCKEFILKNNGDISIVSERGKGTKISITLPLHVNQEVIKYH